MVNASISMYKNAMKTNNYNNSNNNLKTISTQKNGFERISFFCGLNSWILCILELVRQNLGNFYFAEKNLKPHPSHQRTFKGWKLCFYLASTGQTLTSFRKLSNFKRKDCYIQENNYQSHIGIPSKVLSLVAFKPAFYFCTPAIRMGVKLIDCLFQFLRVWETL